jgi:hypothetical protein
MLRRTSRQTLSTLLNRFINHTPPNALPLSLPSAPRGKGNYRHTHTHTHTHASNHLAAHFQVLINTSRLFLLAQLSHKLVAALHMLFPLSTCRAPQQSRPLQSCPHTLARDIGTGNAITLLHLRSLDMASPSQSNCDYYKPSSVRHGLLVAKQHRLLQTISLAQSHARHANERHGTGFISQTDEYNKTLDIYKQNLSIRHANERHGTEFIT